MGWLRSSEVIFSGGSEIIIFLWLFFLYFSVILFSSLIFRFVYDYSLPLLESYSKEIV